jgi:hypothetical protein
MSSNGLIPFDKLPVEQLTTNWSESATSISSNSYFSTTTSGGTTINFVGPCYIYGGFGIVSEHYGYLQYSVDNGVTWKECLVSTPFLKGSDSNSDNLSTWECMPMYIPTGITYKIRIGSTYSGIADLKYGAGFNIRYKKY